MDYDYSKLRGKIREVFGTEREFATAMRLSRASLSFKLNNKSEWTQEEMTRAMDLLNIPHKSVKTYFFTHKV